MDLNLLQHFSSLLTDVHQVQKSIFILESAHAFFRDNRYHGLARNDFFMAHYDAHRVVAVIGLGKIFDTGRRAHSSCYLIRWLRKNQAEFTKEALVARKIESGNTEEEALAFTQDFAGIDAEQVEKLAAVQESLQALYDEKGRKLRNQAFAHRDRNAQPPGLEYEVIKTLANGARGLFEDLFQAYYNAHDFSLAPREFPWIEDLKRDTEAFFDPHKDQIVQVWPSPHQQG